MSNAAVVQVIGRLALATGIVNVWTGISVLDLKEVLLSGLQKHCLCSLFPFKYIDINISILIRSLITL